MSLQDRPGTDGCHVSILVVSYGISTKSHWWETIILDVIWRSIGAHIQLPSHLLWSSNMLRRLSSLQNLLTCLWPLNPWKHLVDNWMRLLHVRCNGFWFIFIIFFILFKYFIEKFPWTLRQRFHDFIFFCTTLFVISLILVHNFWSDWRLLINLISFPFLLFISNRFQKFKYWGKIFLLDNLVDIGVFVPVFNVAERRIEWFRVIVFHYIF